MYGGGGRTGASQIRSRVRWRTLFRAGKIHVGKIAALQFVVERFDPSKLPPAAQLVMSFPFLLLSKRQLPSLAQIHKLIQIHKFSSVRM